MSCDPTISSEPPTSPFRPGRPEEDVDVDDDLFACFVFPLLLRASSDTIYLLVFYFSPHTAAQREQAKQE
jgi:hypothetical protein